MFRELTRKNKQISMEGCGRIEDQSTFAVVGATIADNFGIEMPKGTIGKSILEYLK